MPCRECGKASPFPLCSGCRTVSRIDTLWRDLQEGDRAAGLALLRDCAGALTDLAEASWVDRQRAQPAHTGGAPGKAGETPDKSALPPASEDETARKRSEKPEVEGHCKEDEVKKEPEIEVKREASPSGDEAEDREDSYSYETILEENQVDVKQTTVGESRQGVLGLRELPVKLSRSDPLPAVSRNDHHDRGRERKVSRREEDRARRSGRERDQPAEPDHPPPGRSSGKAVRRSRSRRKRTGKGKRKRERGEAWRRQNPH